MRNKPLGLGTLWKIGLFNIIKSQLLLGIPQHLFSHRTADLTELSRYCYCMLEEGGQMTGEWNIDSVPRGSDLGLIDCL